MTARPLIVFDIQRVSGGTLKAQAKHDLRTAGDLSHTDPSRAHLNRVLVGSGNAFKDCAQIIHEHSATIDKRQEKPFTRIILSATPEHLAEPTNLRRFVSEGVEWLREEYGPGLASVVLHMDEKTPHLHAVCVPLVEKNRKTGSHWMVSHGKHPATSARDSFSLMRRRAAAWMGLGYGETGNKPRSQEQRIMDEATHELAQERAAAIALAARARAVLQAQGRHAEAATLVLRPEPARTRHLEFEMPLDLDEPRRAPSRKSGGRELER